VLKEHTVSLIFISLLYRYVEGLAEIVVRSGSDIARLQDQGNKVRRMAATDMNEHSSRFLCVCACVCVCVCV